MLLRFLSLVIVAGASATAQSTLTAPFNSTGNGSWGNQFDLVATVNPVVVTGFDVNIDPGIWDLEVYRVTSGGSKSGVENNPSAWSLVGRLTGVQSNGLNVPTPLEIPVGVQLSPGQAQGFYVTVTSGAAINYTNGVTPGGVLVQNADLQIREGSGHVYPFQSLFNPRNFNGNIHYVVGSGAPATVRALGTGGGASAIGSGAVYELFNGTSNAFDLSNTAHTYTWFGGGYMVVSGSATPFVTPTGAGQLFSTLSPTLRNDTIENVVLPFGLPTPRGFVRQVWVCSNGYVTLSASTLADFSETVSEFMTQVSRIAPLWDDLNPGQAGSVTAEADPADPTAFHITWNAVPQHNLGDQNTVQLTLRSNGNIEVKYGQVALLDALVGVTTGGGVTDPGSSDYSALSTGSLGPIFTGQQNPPVALVGISRPVLSTTWELQLRDVRPGAFAGLSWFGVSDPMLLDLGIIGMPGNELRSSLEVVSAPFTLGATQTSISYTFTVPALPNLVGFQLFTQALVAGNGLNAFDGLTTNGIVGGLGSL